MLELTTGCVYSARLEQNRAGSVGNDPSRFGHVGGGGQSRVQVVSGANCSSAPAGVAVFLEVMGDKSRNICLSGNDLRGAGTPYQIKGTTRTRRFGC